MATAALQHCKSSCVCDDPVCWAKRFFWSSRGLCRAASALDLTPAHSFVEVRAMLREAVPRAPQVTPPINEWARRLHQFAQPTDPDLYEQYCMNQAAECGRVCLELPVTGPTVAAQPTRKQTLRPLKQGHGYTMTDAMLHIEHTINKALQMTCGCDLPPDPCCCGFAAKVPPPDACLECAAWAGSGQTRELNNHNEHTVLLSLSNVQATGYIKVEYDNVLSAYAVKGFASASAPTPSEQETARDEARRLLTALFGEGPGREACFCNYFVALSVDEERLKQLEQNRQNSLQVPAKLSAWRDPALCTELAATITALFRPRLIKRTVRDYPRLCAQIAAAPRPTLFMTSRLNFPTSLRIFSADSAESVRYLAAVLGTPQLRGIVTESADCRFEIRQLFHTGYDAEPVATIISYFDSAGNCLRRQNGHRLRIMPGLSCCSGSSASSTPLSTRSGASSSTGDTAFAK